MQSAYKSWLGYFRKIVKLLAASTSKDDVPWRAAARMLRTPEFKGTCLGYGSGSIQGRGIGSSVATQIITTGKEIVGLGVDDPEFFALLPLFEEGVGSDLLSDQTTRIIAPYLAEFTVRVLRGTGVQTQDFEIGPERFRLPANSHFLREKWSDKSRQVTPRCRPCRAAGKTSVGCACNRSLEGLRDFEGRAVRRSCAR
jgi:hypothetical protein